MSCLGPRLRLRRLRLRRGPTNGPFIIATAAAATCRPCISFATATAWEISSNTGAGDTLGGPAAIVHGIIIAFADY